MRELAARLAADAHLADDAAQDAWLCAQQQQGPQPGNLRAWLTTVLRNIVTDHHRRAARHARLVAAARPRDARAEDPAATLARLEAHELLVAAVRALEEPYRTVILLRWFDGLPPRAIAQRLSVPVRTVHTRLQRAMLQLRARLHERDPRWPALFTLFPLPASSLATTLAMTTTTTKLGLCAGACALAMAAFALLPDRDPAPVAPAAPAVVAAAPRPDASPASPPVEREAATAAAPAPAQASAKAPWRLTGLVLDVDARPVTGVAVAFTGFGLDSPLARATTATDGTFALTLAQVSGGHVEVDDTRWTAVYRAVLWGSRDVGELTLVVAPTAAVTGIVVDDAGRPVAGASVHATGELPARARFARNLERALEGEWVTTSAADGTFTLSRAPVLPGMQIHGSCAGHRDAHADLTARTGVRLVLPAGAMLEGRVVDPDGQPVAVALFAGDAATMSNADGRFRIDVTNLRSPWLIAARGGNLPARLRCPTDHPERVASWPQPLELRLGGQPLGILGQLYDADGTRVPSPRVRVLDPEFLVEGNEFSTVEFLARVQSRVTENGTEFSEFGFGGPMGIYVGGLQDRTYRLQVEVPGTLQRLVTGPIQAGTHNLELRLPPAAMWPGVAGAVVDRRGAAVAGASVWIEGRVDGTRPRTETLTTDGAGRFAHGPLLRAVDTVLVQTPGIAWPTRFDLNDLGDPTHLRLTAPIATHARIEATHAGDSATFLDANGTAVGVTITQGDRAWGAADVPLTDGRSEVVTVPDDAVVLVLKLAGREVARVPVDLRPGALQVLQP